MPSYLHDFLFDVNFNLGEESVFSLYDDYEVPPLPPIEGYFLYLKFAFGSFDFGLLNGQNLALL